MLLQNSLRFNLTYREACYSLSALSAALHPLEHLLSAILVGYVSDAETSEDGLLLQPN